LIRWIVANADLLYKQYTLANKGGHQDIYRRETRRCVIRTILLLEDVVSLRDKPFPIKTTLDNNFDDMLDKIS
jgi:hypothetical protein